MPSLWHDDGSGWRLLPAAGFDAEQTLHRLVEDAPQMLPLGGSPRLAVIGREVALGSGYADLLAVETTGRLVVIEIKLARNAEARRAVVAQVLAYAAALHGLSPDRLERDVLGSHLRTRGYSTLADAASSADQEGGFDSSEFSLGLNQSLADGRFRLVLVLDQAPPELVRLVGYLEVIADRLLIDLITIAAYDVGGSKVLVPHRVEPERIDTEPSAAPRPVRSGELSIGPEIFAEAIEASPEPQRPQLHRLLAWARTLETEGLALLWSYRGSTGRTTLLPRLKDENVTLVTIYNEPKGRPYLTPFRTVFDRRAPKSIEKIEGLIAPAKIAQGNSLSELSDDVLDAITGAYREAVGRVS